MSEEELKAELEKLKKENSELKKASSKALQCKVSQKGAVSLYGLGRFPVTLYKEQWEKVLSFTGEIKKFIEEHNDELSVK